MWPNYPESYASDSTSTGFAFHAGHVKDDHTRKNHSRDYASENTCLIFGPDTPTNISYNPSAIPDFWTS
jgi:hypothetical protein